MKEFEDLKVGNGIIRTFTESRHIDVRTSDGKLIYSPSAPNGLAGQTPTGAHRAIFALQHFISAKALADGRHASVEHERYHEGISSTRHTTIAIEVLDGLGFTYKKN